MAKSADIDANLREAKLSAELELVRRERDVLLTLAASLMADKLGAAVRDDVLAGIIRARVLKDQALAAAARPTDDVPPRTSSVCPARRSSPTVSEPYAVCRVSGTAPSTSHGSSERNGMT